MYDHCNCLTRHLEHPCQLHLGCPLLRGGPNLEDLLFGELRLTGPFPTGRTALGVLVASPFGSGSQEQMLGHNAEAVPAALENQPAGRLVIMVKLPAEAMSWLGLPQDPQPTLTPSIRFPCPKPTASRVLPIDPFPEPADTCTSLRHLTGLALCN